MTLLLEQLVTQQMDEWMNALGEGRNKVRPVEQAGAESHHGKFGSLQGGGWES